MPSKATNTPPQQYPNVYHKLNKLVTVSKKIDDKLAPNTEPLLSDILPQQSPPSKPETGTVAVSGTSPTAINKTTSSTTASGNLLLCKVCGRNFPPERIELHQNICMVNAQNAPRLPLSAKVGLKRIDGDVEEGNEERPTFPTGHWTKEHERYVGHLKEAKQIIDILSKSVPDIPPPPTEDQLEEEHVQCPHCLRRFHKEHFALKHARQCVKPINNRAKFQRQRVFSIKSTPPTT